MGLYFLNLNSVTLKFENNFFFFLLDNTQTFNWLFRKVYGVLVAMDVVFNSFCVFNEKFLF